MQYLDFVNNVFAIPSQDRVNEQLQLSYDLIAELWRGGNWGHFRRPNDPYRGYKPHWIELPAKIAAPPAWLAQNNHIYIGINPTAESVTDKERREKLKDRPHLAEWQIRNSVCSKIEKISNANCFLSEFDGKDFCTPTDEQTQVFYNPLRADPAKSERSDNELWNQAWGQAQEKAYAADPHYYNNLVWQHIQSLPLKPSVSWFSGGGIQCVWLLDQTFTITTSEDRKFLTSAYKRWVAFVGGDPAASDIARILRLPGSFNKKSKYDEIYGSSPLVSFIEYDLDLRYSIDQIVALLPAEPEKKAAKIRETSTVPVKLRTEKYAEVVAYEQPLSDFAKRVAVEFNAKHRQREILSEHSYVDAGGEWMIRPSGERHTVWINEEKNGSYHHNPDDALANGHLRYPFDVVATIAYFGDYEAAAVAEGRAMGFLRKDGMQAFMGDHRRLVLHADWSKIIPIERQSKGGYQTGGVDRMLYDRVLDVAERYGRTTGLKLSLRTLSEANDSAGNRVSIASPATVRAFLARVDGVLLKIAKSNADTDREYKGHTYDLVDFAVAGLITVIDSITINYCDQSCNDKLDAPEIPLSLGGMKADDTFGRGTSLDVRTRIEEKKQQLCAQNPRYQEAAIAHHKGLAAKPASTPQSAIAPRRSAKAEWIAVMGRTNFYIYRELIQEASRDFLPALGTNGLLVVIDLMENAGATRKEIAERRGMKVYSVGNILRKLEDWGVVTDEQESPRAPKQYTLSDDAIFQFQDRITECRTYKIGVQRLEKRLEQQQIAAENAGIIATRQQDTIKIAVAYERARRAAHRRYTALTIMHPDWTDTQIKEYITAPSIKSHPVLQVVDHRTTPLMRHTALKSIVADLVAANIGGKEAYRNAILAGWDADEARLIAWQCNERIKTIDLKELHQMEKRRQQELAHPRQVALL